VAVQTISKGKFLLHHYRFSLNRWHLEHFGSNEKATRGESSCDFGYTAVVRCWWTIDDHKIVEQDETTQQHRLEIVDRNKTVYQMTNMTIMAHALLSIDVS
jgi:hypothetical protein